MSRSHEEYVEHPRYGRTPRLTGLHVEACPSDPCVFLHWHQGRIPNTALPAETSKQLPATVQVTHYFDLTRTCRRCHRPFIFFAQEQKYWYEELRMPLEVDALHCVPCRRQLREVLSLRQRYEELYHAQRTVSQTYEMAEAAAVLLEEGVFGSKVADKLRGLLRQLPRSEVTSDRFVSLERRLQR